MKLAIRLLVFGSALLVSRSASPCTAINGTAVTWVRDAEVIVRVRVVEERGTRRRGTLEQLRAMYDASGRQFDTTVVFEVLEVLKGDRRLGKQGSCAEYQDCQAQSHCQFTSPLRLIRTGVPSNRVNWNPSKSSV